MSNDIYLRARINEELDTQLRYAAEQRHMTVSAFVREALREVLGVGGTVVDRMGIEAMAQASMLAMNIVIDETKNAMEAARARLQEELRMRFGE